VTGFWEKSHPLKIIFSPVPGFCSHTSRKAFVSKGAVVSILDKTFGKSHQIEIPIGQFKIYDTLKIVVHQCEVQKETTPKGGWEASALKA